jgi:GNAT superfamily N-acetyltransferase
MLIFEKSNKAKQIIQNIQELSNNPFIQLWLKETYEVFCVIKYHNTNPICIAVLHKIDFDPLHKFNKPPLLLDYIYTFPEYRRHNYAYKLIINLIQKNKIIGFCCNDESIKLFVKC